MTASPAQRQFTTTPREGHLGRPITSDNIETFLCTVQGVDHDFRPKVWHTGWGTQRTSWVCVWCAGIACGDYDEPDPCWLVYHHSSGHRSRAGIEWPLGGWRPVESNP